MPKTEQKEPSDQEIAQRRDEVIKRMLSWPPEKHKDVPKRPATKEKPGR
jgi:hypothetical protein